MTDQADTGPIGECGDVPTRPDLWLPCDREPGHNGPHTWPMNPAYTPAVADEVRALRADLHKTVAAWTQAIIERDALAAELAAARDQEVERLRLIRRRILNTVDPASDGPDVRLAAVAVVDEAANALARLSQSGQPTKGEPA